MPHGLDVCPMSRMLNKNRQAIAQFFRKCSRIVRFVRKCFDVFTGFSKFSDLFGPVRTCSDAFGCIWMHLDAFECIGTLSEMQKSYFPDQNFQNFPNASGRIRTPPDASECIRTGPNRSEQVRTGPNRSEQVRKLQKTYEHFKKFAKKSRTFLKKNRERLLKKNNRSQQLGDYGERAFLRTLLEFPQVSANIHKHRGGVDVDKIDSVDVD